MLKKWLNNPAIVAGLKLAFENVVLPYVREWFAKKLPVDSVVSSAPSSDIVEPQKVKQEQNQAYADSN